jgi:hypothetical protein
MTKTIGFIITRYVNSEKTNNYWLECYECIRKFYDYPIIIIDDGSDPNYLTQRTDLLNCKIIIENDFPKCGELLAYYHFYKSHFFDKAIIIHDSVFIQKKIEFEKYDNVNFLWNFEHTWDSPNEEIELLNEMTRNREDTIINSLLSFYHEKEKWKGCYGVQSVIDYSFLVYLEKTYSFIELLKYVNTRRKRMALERIFGLLCSFQNITFTTDSSIFGNIHNYTRNVSTARQLDYDYFYEHYIYDKENGHILHSPIVKVWTGR